ncbi:RluA family pseudouridine synthase [Flavobacteriaceae bacterium]|jgi:23S rRNA pseudouridine1911/1915/1917 synthase|nr:RluA family pseudouridine synthase [Flavobacteriaceae bacterium]
MYPLETHIAKKQKEPIRIQEYAVGIFKTTTTRSAVKKAIKKNLIFVNNSPTTTAKIIVGGEKITLFAPEERTIKPLKLKLSVIFEDNYLAVIEKPAGILVSGNTFKTIDNALEQNINKSNQPDAVKPRPVHRLDYPTTGLLLIGKTSSSIQLLNQLFEHKKIKKIYHAITIGKMNSDGFILSNVNRKEAKSSYKTIHTVKSERFEFLNLVKLSPKTGRRHQLRVHLLSIGNPILGDQKYGIESLILKGKGLYLHASQLDFIHPFTKENLTLTSALPKKFNLITKQILNLKNP